MIKRLFAFIFALMLCFSLIACDNQNKDLSTTSSAISNGMSSEDSEDALSETSNQVSDETSTETSKETSGESSLETSKETTSQSSDESSKETSEPKDTIPPAFIGTVSGKLSKITHNQNENVDLLKDVVARDNLTADKDVVITIIDYAGYSKSKPGNYTITIQAADKAGNKTTIKRDITVVSTAVQKTVVKIGGAIPFSYNEADALSYTSSGTKFRKSDIIQVMTKDFFVSEYNKHSAEHTNNGSVPYFPNGVLLVLDQDMNIVQMRFAVGVTVQIDAAGKLKSTELTWTNAIDKDNGGGLFKGFISELDTLLPKGGFLLFVGNTTPEVCRKFLISKLFYSGYTGGAVAVENKDINITAIKIELLK